MDLWYKGFDGWVGRWAGWWVGGVAAFLACARHWPQCDDMLRIASWAFYLGSGTGQDVINVKQAFATFSIT